MESTLPPFLHIKADNLKKEYENSPVNYEKFIEYDEAAYESTRTSLHAQLEKWYEIHKNVYNEIYIISKSKSLDEYYITPFSL